MSNLNKCRLISSHTGKPTLVVCAVVRVVELEMVRVPLRELLNRILYLRDSALFTHLLGTEVAVRTGAVPVACKNALEEIQNEDCIGLLKAKSGKQTDPESASGR